MVNLVISCRNLPNLDFGLGRDQSDPLCEVFIKEEKHGHMQAEWAQVGRTEVKKDCLNPNFDTWIKLPYMFETK